MARRPLLSETDRLCRMAPVSEVARDVMRELRFRRAVAKVHSLGPRVMAELLAELGARYLQRRAVEDAVEGYAALDPDVIRALRADEPLPPVIRQVSGE